MSRLILFLSCCLLFSCSKHITFDPRTVETEAGAAVVRQLIDDCPYKAADRPMCLTLGPAQLAVSPAFKEKFPEFKDRLLAHNQVAVTVLGDKARVQQKSTGLVAGPLVLLLQISEMNSASGGYEAIAAWAFKDDLMRRKYIVTAQPDGSFKATAGDILEQKKAPESTEAK